MRRRAGTGNAGARQGRSWLLGHRVLVGRPGEQVGEDYALAGNHPPDLIGDLTRTEILCAAREAFAESGYNVPLDEIATRAGVGPGTVYRHFPAKDALFQAVVAARIEDLIDDARARARADDPGSAFFGFLARISEEAAAKRDLPDAMAIAGSLHDALHAAFDVLLRRAQESGAVRADIGTADLIVLLKGLFASIRDASPGATDRALRDRVFAILTDGLRQSAERIPKAGERAVLT